MPRLVIARSMALAIAFIASFAAPVSALAHAHAHHEILSVHLAFPHADADAPVQTETAVTASESGPEHGHPTIASGVATRGNSAGMALLSSIAELPPLAEAAAGGCPCIPRIPVGPSSSASPPAPTRAPPVRL